MLRDSVFSAMGCGREHRNKGNQRSLPHNHGREYKYTAIQRSLPQLVVENAKNGTIRILCHAIHSLTVITCHTDVADNDKSRNMQIPCHASTSDMHFLRGRERRNSAFLRSVPTAVAENTKLG